MLRSCAMIRQVMMSPQGGTEFTARGFDYQEGGVVYSRREEQTAPIILPHRFCTTKKGV
ncbi:MAG: hypothetical protein H6Q55_515 [Deltaproteobacteria bacterium]|nr:hypothetical protein [Deltaproteobacteria bacterium]